MCGSKCMTFTQEVLLFYVNSEKNDMPWGFKHKFEPAIPASELPSNHALDRATIGISRTLNYRIVVNNKLEGM
jgi:hypothetical protein